MIETCVPRHDRPTKPLLLSPLTMIWIATYLVAGAGVGFLAGLLGIGGGMTLVPILATLFGAQSLAPDYNVHLALGTGMASVLFTSSASVREHHRTRRSTGASSRASRRACCSARCRPRWRPAGSVSVRSPSPSP